MSSWVLSHIYIVFFLRNHLPERTSFFKGCPFQGDPLQTGSATLICLYLPQAKQRSQFSSLLARKTNSDNLKHSRLLREHSVYKNNQVHIYFVCLLVLEHFESTWVIFSNSPLQLGSCMYILFTSHMAFFPQNAHAFLWLGAKKHRSGYKIYDKSRKLMQSKFEMCNFPWPDCSFPLLREKKRGGGASLQSFAQLLYSHFCSSKGETKDRLSRQIICCYNRKLHLVQSVSYTKQKLKFPCADTVYSHRVSLIFSLMWLQNWAKNK